MKIWKLLSCIAAITFSVSTWATDEDTPFAALQWNFGAESLKPDIVIGYRSVDVRSDGDVSGWQASASYEPGEGIDKLKLEGVTGDVDIQYTYGGGYSLQEHRPLVSIGVNGSYLLAGADYVIGGHKKIVPYIGLTTINDYDVPREPVVQQPAVEQQAVQQDGIEQPVGETPQIVINNNLQVEHFPEFRDCNC